MASNEKLLEISQDDVPKLMNVLKELLPDTVAPYHWILTHQKWQKKIPHLKVKVMCLNGDWDEQTVVCLADGLAASNKIYGAMYAPEEKIDRLKAALMHTDLIEWDRLKQFSACLKRIVPLMAEVFKFKGFKHTDDFIYSGYQYYMSVQDAANIDLGTLPENVRVGPLDVSHLQIVCDLWQHFDPEYQPVAMKMLELNPSVGVFVKNDKGDEDLASMVLMTEYGGVGLLQTAPEHRRKGYAEIALAHLTRRLGQMGYMPSSNVTQYNEASHSLFKKMGYKVVDAAFWVLAFKLPEK
ncbi:Hypothetical predicted protein [Cloeon dipterum]|uniref:N-acetyltransferase domain-containing protein n=2 Tax=Cloeon dipterum TaxID=197152 RepID=A0A8S1C8I9_9INSE|nr:Hypothetical predicted protein [Cloeon dipterum]